MTVTLPPDLERLVDAHVAAGRAEGSEHVLRDALTRYFAADGEREAALARLDRALGQGLEDLDAGRRMTAADARRRVAALLAGHSTETPDPGR